MGIIDKERFGILIGMKEYQWVCVFMICANNKKKKEIKKKKNWKDGEHKSTGNKSF